MSSKQFGKKMNKKKWHLQIEFEGPQEIPRIDNIFSTVLDVERKKFLKEHGYVRIPKAISKTDIEKALRIINIGILEEGVKTSRKYDPVQKKYVSLTTDQSYSYKLRGHDDISNLCNSTPVAGIMADLLGLKSLPKIWGAQIALLFPDQLEKPIPIEDLGFHIDGEPNHDNDAKFNGQPQLSIYTALVGVYLKDIKFDNYGNFSVYPGSHYAHANHIKQFGQGSFLTENGRLKMPISKAELNKPVQTCVEAGDIVIANYLTAHAIACHMGPEIRYALYFRLSVDGLEEHRNESLTDPWYDWPGLAEDKLAGGK